MQRRVSPEEVTFLCYGGHFGDLRAEISPFSAHRSRNLYMNDVKCILHSSNQTYMTIQVIFGDIEEPNIKKCVFYFLRGGHFSDFSAKFPYFFLDIDFRHQLLLGIDIKVDPRLVYNI